MQDMIATGYILIRNKSESERETSTRGTTKAAKGTACSYDDFMYDSKVTPRTVAFAPRAMIWLCRVIYISTINVNVHTYTLPTIT